MGKHPNTLGKGVQLSTLHILCREERKGITPSLLCLVKFARPKFFFNLRERIRIYVYVLTCTSCSSILLYYFTCTGCVCCILELWHESFRSSIHEDQVNLSNRNSQFCTYGEVVCYTSIVLCFPTFKVACQMKKKSKCQELLKLCHSLEACSVKQYTKKTMSCPGRNECRLSSSFLVNDRTKSHGFLVIQYVAQNTFSLIITTDTCACMEGGVKQSRIESHTFICFQLERTRSFKHMLMIKKES